ncbi:PREDICTED: beta-microseminoprotein-like isoform X1 [Ficedula albicollis]|uniref:beta-microseminoprotein-like isoform X1 n=1 Tax=Ficedula albicollis TaxID=59894 RepID=UPI0007AD86D2|nr:PREDICTED: beta-microseminoprotein-like isoform X1 [Ficedula albicollis]
MSISGMAEKIFLAFFVAVGSIVTLGDAGCIAERRKPWWPHKGCMINGKIYPLGHIERTEFCYKCDCEKDQIRCCSCMIDPPQYDGEKCKVIFNRKTCDYDVVQKDDPSKECFSYSRMC